ncbi:hypothetical protein FP2506_10756 [Fulvimarina pelagi HTCC2506]|uniref:DUF423 domain-containing protein n=1 Tax=Fulvimarina pelagi HTCC2506 TaxID=314231 RepID=Q0G4U5_9HYPH|nr:DUF423 domain-containing protein [Fulvimarina pelagi]EAU43319.1 hypothetical protein FP2506_10756 [Fulvimarina pelagi HTCC2506]
MRGLVRASIQFLASLVGASGVAFAAYASHGTADQALAVPAAGILLAHAPVLLALSIMADRSPGPIGSIAFMMTIGLVLFSSDLAARIWLGDRLFEGAAPVGGGAIILAWLILAVEAIFSAATARQDRTMGERRSETKHQGKKRVARFQ